MADPDFVEKLDVLDKISVSLYRLGISLFSLCLLLYSLILFSKAGWLGTLVSFEHYIIVGLCVSSALSAANIHVYSKAVRAVIAWSSWIGVVIMASQPTELFFAAGLGFLFVTFSGIALKESFCFRVIGLKFIPLFLAPATFLIISQLWLAAGLLLLVSSFILSYLSVQKWKMPLHFDIGKKSNYQI